MLIKVEEIPHSFPYSNNKFYIMDDLFGRVKVEVYNHDSFHRLNVFSKAIAAVIYTYQSRNLPVASNVIIALSNIELLDPVDSFFNKVQFLHEGIKCAEKMLPSNSLNKLTLFDEIYQSYLKLVLFT